MRLARRKTLLIAGILGGAVALLLLFWGARGAGLLGGSEHERAGAASDPDSDPDSASAQAARDRLAEVSIQLQKQRELSTRTGPGGEPMALLEERLERAQSHLARYREATKYPPTSQPIAAQPGQAVPHSVPPTRLPLVGLDGKPSDKTAVILRQDYFYLAGSETVTLSVECGTIEGTVPCEIMSSTAKALGGTQRADVPFTPEAGGVLHAAMFQPGSEGFADYHGPIRVELTIRIAGEPGTAAFDLEYTAKPPAVFTGRFSEKLVKGSLVLGAELQVEKPGRYVLAARVDDSTGRSFGYVAFNDELPKGRAEAELVVFGKLILDEKAVAPFRLRDVEGFLLKEDVYPDRELLPTLEDVVYTTKSYREQDFSDEEWQSDERQRHLDEFERDVERAKSELEDAKR
jgi:hypothetical protein